MQALLLLADGRFPAGGHAHSAGVEAAVADGRVTDVASLTAFTEGRLRTVGLVEVTFAMVTASRFSRPMERGAASALLALLAEEMDARIPVPSLRAMSRRLGRQLLRVASRCWPSPLLTSSSEQGDPHQAVAFGLAGAASLTGVAEVGQLTAHHAVTTPMQAGVRLLGLDPFAVAAATARLAEVSAALVAEAGARVADPLSSLPAGAATLADIAAAAHSAADGRLFAT